MLRAGTRTLVAAAAVVAAVGCAADDPEPDAGPTTSVAVTTVTTAPGGDDRPAAEVAAAVLDAWEAGDGDAVAADVDAGVAEVLLAWDPGAGPWEDAGCEGAAGSSWCGRSSGGAEVTVRVANDPSVDGPRVTEARLEAAGDAVALWPLTTGAQAAGTQVEVDGGSSPWQLEPAAVVDSYARAELGFADPAVEAGEGRDLVVTDVTTGARVTVGVGQPARTGDGGIWAVIEVVAVPG